jgi:hypothetical protein
MMVPNSHIFYGIRQPEAERGIVTKIVSGVPLPVNLSKALNMVTFGIGKMVTAATALLIQTAKIGKRFELRAVFCVFLLLNRSPESFKLASSRGASSESTA